MFSFTDNGENSTADDSSELDEFEVERVQQPTSEKEARLVSCSRISMVIVLLVSAASVSYLTYRFVKDEETQDFRLQVSHFLCARLTM